MKYQVSQNNTGNYESLVSEVEGIIKEIEAGNLPLEKLFQQFEIAANKLKRCEDFLVRHQREMSVIIETLEDDQDIDQDLQDLEDYEPDF